MVDQKQIGNVTETLKRFLLIGADRFILQISAHGHDGKGQFGQQQMMQRRVESWMTPAWGR